MFKVCQHFNWNNECNVHLTFKKVLRKILAHMLSKSAARFQNVRELCAEMRARMHLVSFPSIFKSESTVAEMKRCINSLSPLLRAMFSFLLCSLSHRSARHTHSRLQAACVFEFILRLFIKKLQTLVHQPARQQCFTRISAL